MNFKKSLWKLTTFLVVVFFLLKPEFMMLGLFIDGIGLELFLLLLEVQFVAVGGYYFREWFKPVLKPIYVRFQKIDPYFFVPTKSSLAKIPGMMLHAIPGFLVFYLDFWFVIPDQYST